MASVCSAPSSAAQHAQEPALTADTAHSAPIFTGFLSGEHCAIDFAKLHRFRSPWLSSLAE
jgi:hypothetical protein